MFMNAENGNVLDIPECCGAYLQQQPRPEAQYEALPPQPFPEIGPAVFLPPTVTPVRKERRYPENLCRLK